MQSTVDASAIKRIVELDKQARERVAEAKRQAEEIDAEALKKKDRILNDYRSHTKNRLSILEDSCKKEAEEKISEIEAKTKEKTDAFDKAFEENRKALADKVFLAVTGRKRG
ncbi:MAG: hypothetical protein NC203_04465 [Firmicutes bacterium]|nr:hypothetical protein [[Eubacterium] siraeum]MCM1487604.1 hypothetical protein [Bacillota bacterium]